MYKGVCIFLMILCVSPYLYAQKEYSSQNTSQGARKVAIFKARNSLKEAFIVDDMMKMDSIATYLTNSLNNNSQYALNPNEKILLDIRAQKYRNILRYVDRLIAGDSEAQFIQSDELTETLNSYFETNRSLTLSNINKSSLSGEEKQFMYILLDYLTVEDDNHHEFKKSCTSFIKEYPDSQFIDLVRSFSGQYEKSDWGLGYFMGAGMASFKSDMGNYIDQSPYFEIGAEVMYKKIYLGIDVMSGSRKLQQNYLYDDILWEKGKKASWASAGLDLGYSLLYKKEGQHRIIPFLQVGGMRIRAVNDDIAANKALENIKLNALYYGVGLQYCYSFFRLRYSYTQSNFPAKRNIDGSIHKISLGLNFFIRTNKKNK